MAVEDTSFLHIHKLNPLAIKPTRHNETDAGWDLYSIEDCLVLQGRPSKIKTGLAIKIPEGYVGMICSRGSTGSHGLEVGAGIVDSGFCGEIEVILNNLNNNPAIVHVGAKVAQLVIMPILQLHGVFEVKELWNSERGNKGWGSSGV